MRVLFGARGPFPRLNSGDFVKVSFSPFLCLLSLYCCLSGALAFLLAGKSEKRFVGGFSLQRVHWFPAGACRLAFVRNSQHSGWHLCLSCSPHPRVCFLPVLVQDFLRTEHVGSLLLSCKAPAQDLVIDSSSQTYPVL